MTINLIATTETATGGTAQRLFSDRMCKASYLPPECVNVKDFGAKGDGGTDDTTAINHALNYAWSGFTADPTYDGTTHTMTNYTGAGTKWKNKPIYFPAGTYNISSTINILGVHGAYLFGDGPYATILKWTGTITGSCTLDPDTAVFTGTWTNMFLTNGFGRSTIRDLCLDMGTSAANRATDGTMCFNWNWDGGSSGGATFMDVNTTLLKIKNVLFRNATIGFSGAPNAPATLPPNATTTINQECDTCTFTNCAADNCYVGFASWNANAIGYSAYGGSVSNCNSRGFRAGLGFSYICGINFVTCPVPIAISGTPCYIYGCNTDGRYFVFASGNTTVTCCKQTYSGSDGVFVYTGGSGDPAIIDQCNATGGVAGSGEIQIRDSTLAADPFNISGAVFGGNLTYWQVPTGNYASRPTNPYKGMEMIITDSTTTTFGATIAGTGGSEVRGRYNGSNWTVCGI